MQLAVNTVVAASTLVLMAVGFSLIFSTVRFFHFAHGIVFTVTGYCALLLESRLHLPAVAALPLSVLTAVGLGCIFEIGIYRSFRRRGASSLVLLLVSLGTYIVAQNGIAMCFGDDTKSIRSDVVSEGLGTFGAIIMPVEVAAIATSLVLVTALVVFLKRARMGKALRAVANDPSLAGLSGIRSDRVILWSFAIGSGLAAVAGLLVSLEVDMTPTMGMNVLMVAVVAVIIGGVGSLSGAVIASLLLSFVQQMTTWIVGSQWQDVLVFVMLLAFLLLRPQGLCGRSVRKATV